MAALVVGIGVDIVSVERLRRALTRRPRLIARLFADDELPPRQNAGFYRSLAARLAAKEAARKALGARGGAWRDAVVAGGYGAPPRLLLVGTLADRARVLGARRWQLSLSHERDHAVAMVVMES